MNAFFYLTLSLLLAHIVLAKNGVSLDVYSSTFSGDDSSDTLYPYVTPWLTVKLGFGNPVQHFNVTLDVNWDSVYIFSSSITSMYPTKCPNEQRHFFNKGRSTTFTGTPICSGCDFGFNYPYITNCQGAVPSSSGLDGNDDAWVGSQRVNSVDFELITYINGGILPNWPSDGVIGFGYEDNPDFTGTLHQLANGLGEPVVSFYYKRLETKVVTNEIAGTLTIGARDSTNCASNWTKVQRPDDDDIAVLPQFWNIVIDRFDVGNFSQSNLTAQMSLQPTITASYDLQSDIANAIGATFNKTLSEGGYVVDCKRVSEYPDLVFQMGSMEYRIPASDYVGPLNPPDPTGQTCYLLIDNMINGEYDFAFGLPAARSHCWLMDYGDGSVSFSKVK